MKVFMETNLQITQWRDQRQGLPELTNCSASTSTQPTLPRLHWSLAQCPLSMPDMLPWTPCSWRISSPGQNICSTPISLGSGGLHCKLVAFIWLGSFLCSCDYRYLQHHYAVDLIAGSALSLAVFLIAKNKFLARLQPNKMTRWDYDYAEIGNKASEESYGLHRIITDYSFDSDEWTVGSSSSISSGTMSPADETQSLWEGETSTSHHELDIEALGVIIDERRWFFLLFKYHLTPSLSCFLRLLMPGNDLFGSFFHFFFSRSRFFMYISRELV